VRGGEGAAVDPLQHALASSSSSSGARDEGLAAEGGGEGAGTDPQRLSLDAAAAHTDAEAGFAVITLDEAERLARANHPALKRARAELAGAEAGVVAARAPLLPQLRGNASWQYQDRPGVQIGSSFVRSGGHSFAVGVYLDQQITDFGRTTNRLRAAGALEDAQEASVQDVEAMVLANVRQAFFLAQAQKAFLAVSRRTLENQQRHLDQVSAFVELGERAPYDLAQARTNVGAARSQLASAEGNYRIARAGLIQAMGISRSSEIEVADQSLPRVEGEDAPIDALLAEALEARPDIVALDQRIRAQAFTVRSNVGGYWPILAASGNVSGVGPGFHDLDGPAWIAGISLSWPLFQGGATLAAVNQAEASLAALESDREALAQQVRYELEQSLAAIRTAVAAREAADETLTSAHEQVRLATGRYETGLGSLLELADAELALQQAEAARVQADYDLSAARALLIERLGR